MFENIDLNTIENLTKLKNRLIKIRNDIIELFDKNELLTILAKIKCTNENKEILHECINLAIDLSAVNSKYVHFCQELIKNPKYIDNGPFDLSKCLKCPNNPHNVIKIEDTPAFTQKVPNNFWEEFFKE